MPRYTAKIKAAARVPAALALITAALLAPACGSGRKGLELPANPVLGIDSRWGAVSSAYVRVKAKPSSQAEDSGYLRRAELVEVVAREIGKDCLPEESGYWYGIKIGSGTGWVFSGYVEVYDSKDKARSAIGKMSP